MRAPLRLGADLRDRRRDAEEVRARREERAAVAERAAERLVIVRGGDVIEPAPSVLSRDREPERAPTRERLEPPVGREPLGVGAERAHPLGDRALRRGPAE